VAPVGVKVPSTSVRNNNVVIPSNLTAANIAASLAAGAQQQIYLNLPTGGKLQVVQKPPIFKIKQEIKQEPNTE
jgi:hypothetical protein